MRKILLLVSSMGSGGAERVAATLANAWSTRGDEVILMPTFSGRGDCFYTLSASVQLLYLADITTANYPLRWQRLSRLWALRSFIVSYKPAVIVSFLSNVNVAAILATLGLGIPLIVCERVDPFAMPQPWTLQLATRLVYPLADAVMVQTAAVAEKYRRSGWILRRIPVIPNPLPEYVTNTSRNHPTTTAKRLLGIGRLDAQKQFAVLIRIFAQLVTSHPEWTLRIVGEGRLHAQLQQQIIALGLQERIELAGATKDIARELTAAAIFATTSAYEGFPNALLEAMAMGIACVTFDCPSGPREITEHGKYARLIPAGDERAFKHSLNELMCDDILRLELGRQARTSVLARYSLVSVSAAWDTLFTELGV